MEGAHINFPNLLQLVFIMLLIPVQTAVIERGFSLHEIIKKQIEEQVSDCYC